MNEELTQLAVKIGLAGFGAVGVMEWLKNFFKFKKTWIYALVMPVFAVGCYAAVNFLPAYVIGSILTVGVVQLNYQVIIQGFKAIIKALLSKTGANVNEEVNSNDNESVQEEGKKDYGEQ
ncbi:MAG: hypothetical protein MJZ37_01135 [Bacilli bacterium]|nr:hypothetical protein [Bacilli bacterium]